VNFAGILEVRPGGSNSGCPTLFERKSSSGETPFWTFLEIAKWLLPPDVPAGWVAFQGEFPSFPATTADIFPQPLARCFLFFGTGSDMDRIQPLAGRPGSGAIGLVEARRRLLAIAACRSAKTSAAAAFDGLLFGINPIVARQ
jgi:hypothetical protein